MTDREQLKRAAKAAGINLNTLYGCDILRNFSEPDHPIWNPLTDDGDALRLAVGIGAYLDFCDDEADVMVLDEKGLCLARCIEPFGEDRYAATRRAIVRAAEQCI